MNARLKIQIAIIKRWREQIDFAANTAPTHQRIFGSLADVSLEISVGMHKVPEWWMVIKGSIISKGRRQLQGRGGLRSVEEKSIN